MVIGTRVLTLRTEAGEVPVPVTLHGPVEDHLGWGCRYEIGWPAGPVTQTIYGIDALQAVDLAMQKVGADLHGSEAHAEGRLSMAGRKGYGFRMSRRLRMSFGLPADDPDD
jgi:hypothetical protein